MMKKRILKIMLSLGPMFVTSVAADDIGGGAPGNGIDAAPPENTETAQTGESLLSELLETLGFTSE